MGIRALTIACLLSASAASAQVPDLVCTGTNPIWTLEILGDTAQFRFADRTIDFDVMDKTHGQPGPWPIALTLVASRDTAIVLVRGPTPFSVDILTQHRELPVLFSGTCDAR